MTQGQPKHSQLNVARRVELVMEHLMFSSRWLLAPLYLGLLLGLIILVLKFFQEFWHLATTISGATLQETTIGILEILDITLLGNLILIVIFSGYENFVSKITIAS
ncbi:MAG TPA: TIGR00645 family protein, partial [Actinobacteria bacterium]|nr:TIGR00645 family protein [Actinomycetota bacterium]